MPREGLNERAILDECPRMGREDTFTFTCDRSLDCFTNCCANVSIVLTPYDIVRLKKALDMDSSEFLARYSASPFTKEQKFPVILLKMDQETKRCPLVTEEGCSVYANRPWACRMYPLGLADPKTPTETDQTFHFLVREELCHGHGKGRTWSVREWTADQGVEQYDMMGASFKELMLHDFWDGPKALTPEQVDMFYMACYDLDRFRRFVFETTFLEKFDVDEARVEAMRRSDTELLDFAMLWLRFCLFGERTVKIRHSVAEARRRQLAEARP